MSATEQNKLIFAECVSTLIELQHSLEERNEILLAEDAGDIVASLIDFGKHIFPPTKEVDY